VPDPARTELPPGPSEEATLPPTAPPRATPRNLPQQFGRYRIDKKLGEGGMGAVYLAHDGQLARAVALKVPFLDLPDRDGVRARFLQEARSAAALHHPNICPIHDLGEIDGIPYLTMPYIEGESLARRVGPGRPLPPREAAALVHKVALALEAAHAHGVIHRDLKPGNVLIDARGEPIVMDFGLARRGETAAHLTQSGQVMGTPAYMAPEQLSGDVKAMGAACDVYSLGVVLYELLTGTPPFQGDLLSITGQTLHDLPLRPSARRAGIDARLDAVCLRALEKKPADRWPSMKEMAAALAAWLGPAPPAARGIADPPVPFHGPASGPLLTLRVPGTPYVYRPAPGQDVVTVGRQRRGPGDPPDHGNDFVLRVAGDERLTTRISRRHFEIRRAGAEFIVIDRSKAGLLLNGKPAPKDAPAPLRSGDWLVVAGVVTLQVVIQEGATGGVVAPVVHVPAPAHGGESAGPVVMEASMGDMVTTD
jgi:hypothetical protein